MAFVMDLEGFERSLAPVTATVSSSSSESLDDSYRVRLAAWGEKKIVICILIHGMIQWHWFRAVVRIKSIAVGKIKT